MSLGSQLLHDLVPVSYRLPASTLSPWQGTFAAWPRVPLGWAEGSLVLFSLPKAHEIKSSDPNSGFYELCVTIFSNPLSSRLNRWQLPRSVNQLPLLYYCDLIDIFSAPSSLFWERQFPSVGVDSEVIGGYLFGGLRPFPGGSGSL